MLFLCGAAGALGTARDALGDRSAELVQGHVLADLAAFGHAVEIEASDHGRRSGPITMIVTSVGRGDVGPFRRDGTNVRRTAQGLVAIGDGADAERARGTCSP